MNDIIRDDDDDDDDEDDDDDDDVDDDDDDDDEDGDDRARRRNARALTFSIFITATISPLCPRARCVLARALRPSARCVLALALHLRARPPPLVLRNGPFDEWIRRRPSEAEIAGSSPGRVMLGRVCVAGGWAKSKQL